jgi:hypothetical protein
MNEELDHTARKKLSPEMQEYRNTLTKVEQDSQVDYDKAILALSGGALGISFAFFKDISERLHTTHAGFLLWAWVSWGLSVATVLASFYTSISAMRKAIKQVDEGEEPPYGGRFDALTKLLNAAGGILFVCGVAFAIIFVYKNLR